LQLHDSIVGEFYPAISIHIISNLFHSLSAFNFQSLIVIIYAKYNFLHETQNMASFFTLN